MYDHVPEFYTITLTPGVGAEGRIRKACSDGAAPQDDPVYVNLHGQATTLTLTLTLFLIHYP